MIIAKQVKKSVSLNPKMKKNMQKPHKNESFS